MIAREAQMGVIAVLASLLPNAWANTITARAPQATDFVGGNWSICPIEDKTLSSSFDSCAGTQLAEALVACTATVAVGAGSCGCDYASRMAKVCLPIVCPPEVGSSLLSLASCNGPAPSATVTTKGGSGSGSVNTVTSSGTVTSTSTSTSGSSGTVTSRPTGTLTDTAASGSGSSSARTTSTSSALAGDVAVPLAGGLIAGLVGAAAFLL